MTTDRRRTPTRRARTLGLSVAGVLAGSVLAAPLVAAKPDTLFPSMGNSGYQVRAYDVAIDYAPLTNRAIAVTKMTALGSVIGVPDILNQATTAQSFSGNASPLTLAALAYVALFLPFVLLARWLETRFAWKRT